MGIRDLFSKRPENEAIHRTKVLVCSLGAKFQELAEEDSPIYSKFYPLTTVSFFSTINELLESIKNKYDVVHLFVEVPADGILTDSTGNQIAGTTLVQKCCESDVKLLWIASDNKPDGYIKGFKGGPINLVMTIKRNDSKFPHFLSALLTRMSSGEKMPTAWVAISPQTSRDSRHADLPATIFSAGRGGAILR